MGVRVDVSFTLNLGRLVDGLPERIAAGETKAAERLLALSAEQVPLDIGTLQGSGAVVPATDPERGAQVVYDTPYAARLHEHPEYDFQGGRKGKYVEDPAVENRKELGDIIRKEVLGG